MLSLIVAMDAERGIGLNSFLPWRIKEDLQLFKSKTEGHTIIMGQTTFEGLPKALPNRHTIVVSADEDLAYDDANVSVSNDLIGLLVASKESSSTVYVCGGMSIYRQALPYVDSLCVSHVNGIYEVDTYFPEINFDDYEVTYEKQYQEFVYREYKRR